MTEWAPAGLVTLDRDHPGFRDPAYRARRNHIARVALDYRTGPVPRIDYTDEEHGVWRTVWAELGRLHKVYAHSQVVGLSAALALDHDRIPQLEELNTRLTAATGFRMLPVAGLVQAKDFLSQLGNGCFLSTQYMRHPSSPLYTPEPDVIHELVGHAATLMHPGLADLNRQIGRAAQRATRTEEIAALERLYWYTLEFGVVVEDRVPRAFGAGLLSSFGEIATFAERAELRPWDVDAMAHTDYDPTTYQPVLFVAPSFERMVSDLTAWAAAR